MNSGYDRQASVFQAMSHPVRLHVLDILARQEACVCHLTAILGKRQPYVSQQLATLREAGLVMGRREGTLIYYRLANESLVQLIDQGKAAVGELFGEDADFPALPEERLAECPCPRCLET